MQPPERLVSIEIGKRFPLNGIDVRAIAGANAPEGLVALSGRQGLWLASPEDSSGERHLTRAITKDASGKWLDLGSLSWCPDLRRAGWLGVVRQRSVLLWDAGVGRTCGNIEVCVWVHVGACGCMWVYAGVCMWVYVGVCGCMWRTNNHHHAVLTLFITQPTRCLQVCVLSPMFTGASILSVGRWTVASACTITVI